MPVNAGKPHSSFGQTDPLSAALALSFYTALCLEELTFRNLNPDQHLETEQFCSKSTEDHIGMCKFNVL